jgi:hypothetical protein
MSLVDQELFPVPRSEAAVEVAKLHARRRELQQGQRQALTARDSARAQHERLSEQIRSTEALALAYDKQAKTGRDKTRLDKLADEVADRDARAVSLGAAIVAVDSEIRRVAGANYPELRDEAIADHEQARHQIDAQLAALAAAQARARAAYVTTQALASNAGDMAATRGLRDVPSVEQIVRDGGLGPLIPDHDRVVITT